MSRIFLGVVEESEKLRIQQLNSRQSSLSELIEMFKEKGEDAATNKQYAKALLEFHETHREFHRWWEDVSNKYQWKVEPSNNWFIDFGSNAVYLS